MPVFKFKAALKNGKKKKGIIDASNRAQAIRKLRAEGQYPIEVSEVRSSSNSSDSKKKSGRSFRLKHRVPRDAVAASIRQLATLLKADLPLDKALNAIIEGDSKRTELQSILIDIRENIREGGDLASSFGKHPHVFNTTFVTMVRAGESSGTLDIVMERLADHIEQQLALRRKVQATLAYPALMAIVGVLVVVFLLSFVVPKVTEIFFDMERALPLPTQILITVSDLVRKSWSVLLLIVVALGYGGFRFRKTEQGKAAFDNLLLKTPVLGDVIRQLSVGRFAKTLGMLLKNGAPLVSSLEIVKSVIGIAPMKDLVEQIHSEVQEGKPLTGPMNSSDIFEHATIQMIAAGEQSGQLDEMLLIVANDCENKVDTKLQLLTSLMEPLMILFLGGVVGFVVMAIMLPIFEMSNLVSG